MAAILSRLECVKRTSMNSWLPQSPCAQAPIISPYSGYTAGQPRIACALQLQVGKFISMGYCKTAVSRMR